MFIASTENILNFAKNRDDLEGYLNAFRAETNLKNATILAEKMVEIYRENHRLTRFSFDVIHDLATHIMKGI